jgi:hypothetical protein
MANKRRKCKFCLEFQPAEDGIKTPSYWFCSPEHAAKFASSKYKQQQVKNERAQKIKREKKIKNRIAQRKYALKTASQWNKEAQAAVNRYIRARDRNKPCVSCGCDLSVNYGGTTDCGHYRSRGSASHLRFNLLNMASQCSRCNRYLSGNIVEYRKELINRIGVERVEALENDNEPRKFDIDYIKRVKKIFNKRARFYEKRKPSVAS